LGRLGADRKVGIAAALAGDYRSRVRVSLFVTCLIDQLLPGVGIGTLRLLRRLGCEVTFDPRQTCCGQPACNAGERSLARGLAQRWIELFEGDPAEAIVCPSGSCTAMVAHFVELFEADARWQERARAVAARTHELSAFVVDVLGVRDAGGRFEGRLGWHDACHGLRDLGLRAQGRALLQHVAGAELVELRDAEACCGFGGVFAVRYPELSVAIAERKLEAIEQANVDAVVSGDVGCLLQLGGRLARRGSRVRALHLAEVLAGEDAS
jgi:L-lactate dehydrogenase complex protein LldE